MPILLQDWLPEVTRAMLSHLCTGKEREFSLKKNERALSLQTSSANLWPYSYVLTCEQLLTGRLVLPHRIKNFPWAEIGLSALEVDKVCGKR